MPSNTRLFLHGIEKLTYEASFSLFNSWFIHSQRIQLRWDNFTSLNHNLIRKKLLIKHDDDHHQNANNIKKFNINEENRINNLRSKYNSELEPIYMKLLHNQTLYEMAPNEKSFHMKCSCHAQSSKLDQFQFQSNLLPFAKIEMKFKFENSYKNAIKKWNDVKIYNEINNEIAEGKGGSNVEEVTLVNKCASILTNPYIIPETLSYCQYVFPSFLPFSYALYKRYNHLVWSYGPHEGMFMPKYVVEEFYIFLKQNYVETWYFNEKDYIWEFKHNERESLYDYMTHLTANIGFDGVEEVWIQTFIATHPSISMKYHQAHKQLPIDGHM